MTALQLTTGWLSDRFVVLGKEVEQKLLKVFSDETSGVVTVLLRLDSGSMETSRDS